MQLTCSTSICPDLLLPQALDFVKKAGFEAIELFRARTASTPVHPDLSVPMVRRHLREAGIQLTGLNIRNLTGRKADSDERNLSYNLYQVEWDIHLARALGLKTANLKGGERTEEALEDLIHGINQLLERIPDITLNLGSQQGNRLQGLADFKTVLPHLNERARVQLDTGQLLAAGEDVMDCAYACADRIGLVRLCDRRGKKPLQLGQGDLPCADLLRLLHRIGYKGNLVLALEPVEGKDALPAAIAARTYVQNLLTDIQSQTREYPMKNITVNDFRDYTRDRFIDAQTGAAAKLSPTLHLTHESGVEGQIREELNQSGRSRVVFDIPSGKVKSAELLFYVNADSTTQEKPMRLLVNGHRLSHRQNRERMLTGGWDRKRIPARMLRDGRNEFIFSHHGVLHVDPGPGGHSSRSFDGGKTWHEAALGPDNDVRGEYMVRLRLKGYAPSGQLTSPFIDLADPHHEGRIAPPQNIQKIRLTAQTRTPAGSRIQFEMRSGSSPAFDPRFWTPWERRTTLERPGRFVQFRATLSTRSADKTPTLESIALQVNNKEDKTALEHLKLLELDHPEIARSSYDFTYMAPHPRLERLRKQYRLDEVVAAGETELEKFALLRDWVHSQWLGWQADKYPYCPPWDPLEILETTKGNWGFGMCTHYGAVFTGCAAALGYVARVLIVDHHCLAEIWSEELQKWILQDPGPGREHDATYESRGVPVNALEFHHAFVQKKARFLKINKLPQKTTAPMTQQWGGLFRRFGIPPRNNHLVYAEPAELRHGYQQYHYDGYLWWSVDIDPQFAEYSLQTSRPADFYWSVNQTRLYLQSGSAPDTLQVDLETVTPNFSHFLVQVDEGEWEKQQAPLQWQLHPGENKLAVRSENVFGKQGRIARARVHCKA